MNLNLSKGWGIYDNLVEYESIGGHGIALHVNSIDILQLNIFQKKLKNSFEIKIL